ncbi:MAG TPA: DNA-formamidopyrimidine glycosylase family protein [Jatrophihabitans sp.]|nr:DNA-formamidopyrimidine glycosylase family protein [Jatrophihabitans sp.]
MPELPDVEGFRAALAASLPGRRIAAVEVFDAGVLRNSTARAFAERVTGHRFETPCRRGKWLLLPTDGPTVLVHSGMTGHPYYVARPADPDRFDRLRLALDRGEFRFSDMRKLRGVWVADGESTIARILGDLGPDALDVDRDDFASALRSTRRLLKTALTDQTVIAGLGNLLADEICWQARIHPLRGCRDLDADQLRLLHGTMRRVLRTSVRHGRVPGLRCWLTRVRDDHDAACPRCGTPLTRARNAGRTTVWCPQEQR